MKKIISFSLYGNNLKYCNGLLENIKLQKQIYPDWICRVYYNNTVPEEIINKIKSFNCELFDMSNTELKSHGMFWRFLPYDDANVERFIVRDTDSRLNEREKNAVDEWIKSNCSLHIMRDHPQHGVLILGGTWGLKNDLQFNMKELILEFIKNRPIFKYGDDQVFLIKLHKKYINDMICHDDFFDFPNNQKFPSGRLDYEFVGEVFDEKNQRNQQHRLELINFLKQ